jgi:hypothetical protein
VHRAGHCAFTPAETITAANTLLQRLSTGKWPSIRPRALNKSAAALGPTYNIFQSGNKVVPTPPMFLNFHPGPYLRPFDAGSKVP